MRGFEHIQTDVTDGVATLTLNRPPLNVMHIPMMAEINAALEPVVRDEAVAAILFRAEGKAFSAGVDIADHTAEKVGDMIRVFHDIFRKLARTDALTIAAVNGAALGGGCELAAFCDVVLASTKGKFGQPEVMVGCFPPVAASVLPLKIGLHRAIEFNALGATIDAAEAHRIGLASRLFAAEEFSAGVETYMTQIRKLSRPVIRLAKRATSRASSDAILAHLEKAEELYLRDLMKLSDAHEGLAAFMEKRSPNWTHN
ncbi:MAG: enoyl-CoA hydratase/isomerase family protein [Phycisphaerales bacterium]|nr:enoyl-CoA hydratase/isomerase family protein [Phycisphaerales bacterium]